MRLIGGTLIFVAVPATAIAHHSTRAFYDRDASMELEGTVESVFWRNPHVGLTILVRNEQGAQEEWKLEGGAMNSLQRRGFAGDSVAIGDYVRVAGAPSTRGDKALFVTNFLLPSGREVIFTDTPQPLLWTRADEDRSADAPATSGSRAVGEESVANIFRVWNRGEAYRLRAPLKLTSAAGAAKSSWDPTTDDPALRCEAPGMPNAILNPYPIEFVDEGSQIRLKIEEWDAVRLINMSDAGLSEDITSNPLGYSRGRWEGDTLIVQTSKVNAPYLDDGGTPQSESVQMLERFTLRREEGRLDYEVTVTDPENLVEPAVWVAAWVWRRDVHVRPFECTTR